MQRYFLQEPIPDYKVKDIYITGEQYHHMHHVLRMQVGDMAFLVLPSHTAFKAKISAADNEKIIMNWVEDEEALKELPIDVTIASGLPKGDKLDYIVQKGTELGASAFIPFSASFSIAKWDRKKAEKKVQRLRKIALEAAEQAHRTVLPEVHPVHAFSDLLQKVSEFDVCLVAYEEESKAGETSNFAKVLHSLKPGSKILIIFGPEGGISTEEVMKLTNFGVVFCGLGPRILRTETAPLYALSAISYHYELNKPGYENNSKEV